MPTAGGIRYVEALPPGDVRSRGTLLLLHAFPLNARMWEPQLELASGGWRVIAPHLRGFDGGSDSPPAGSMDDYAGDVIDLLDALHVHDGVVGGASMGGYVMLTLLRHAASYVRGLILADTRPQADTAEGIEGRRRMLQLLTDQGVAGVADDMLPKLLGESTRASAVGIVDHVRSLVLSNPPAAISGAVLAMMTRTDSTPLLAAIHVPTLIIVGEEDKVTPPAISEEMQRAIAGSELAIIPRAGHLPNLEQPAAFNAAVERFLAHRV